MLGGIGLLGLLYQRFPPGFRPALPERWWWLMLALLALPIARRCVTTVADPTPERVQLAVKHCLLSIIVLDAAVTLVAGSGYDAVLVLPAVACRAAGPLGVLDLNGHVLWLPRTIAPCCGCLTYPTC